MDSATAQQSREEPIYRSKPWRKTQAEAQISQLRKTQVGAQIPQLRINVSRRESKRTPERESKRISDIFWNRPNLSLRGRVENQAQLGLVWIDTPTVTIMSPLCILAFSMSHTIVFYDT